ncbi:MAG: hypothetical protein LAC69_00115 [Chlorobium sp.]|jgi:hypothetical protein|nr:hypothetical protein [Chlorobium sp.]
MGVKEEVNMEKVAFGDIGDSDEVRIQKIQNAFQCSENIKESCHFLVNSVEHSLEYLKERRNDVSSKLCEALAKKESLRKKDYNIIISEIYNLLDEKERNAKNHFFAFIEDQKEFTQSLKNIILNISDYSSTDFQDKTALLKEELVQIAEIQEKRKETVIKILTNFQDIHKEVMTYLESLLEKGGNINIRDIKNAKYIISKEQY